MKRSPALLFILTGFAFGAATTVIGASMLGSAVFPDVRQGSYYDEAIGEMYEAGIIRGYANGKFGPDDPVTRGQIAVLFKRLRDDILGTEVSVSFGGERTQTSSSASSVSSASSESSVTSSSSSMAPVKIPAEGGIRFTTATFDVAENVGEATISLIRTGGKEGVVSVLYRTDNVTAKMAEDYTQASGKLTFASDEAGRTFTVPIIDDATEEGVETVKLSISNPDGGAIIVSPDTATLTIKDNDGVSGGSSTPSNGTINFSAKEYQAAEAAKTIMITIERIGGSVGAVTVKFGTANASAQAGVNYEATSGTLNFADGETTKSFPITIVDNSTINGYKAVTLSLSSPTGGATVGSQGIVSLVIIDDEVAAAGTGSLKFDRQEFKASEEDGKAIVVVERVGGTKGQVVVDYLTIDGDARAGKDYTSSTGKLTFRDGESAKTLAIPILRDNDNDSGEAFTVELRNPTSGAKLIAPTTTNVVIE